MLGEIQYPSPSAFSPAPPSLTLTSQEIHPLRHSAQGLSTAEIAKEMTLSEQTVGIYVSNILKKLHPANRTQAALFALREGWADLKHSTQLDGPDPCSPSVNRLLWIRQYENDLRKITIFLLSQFLCK